MKKSMIGIAAGAAVVATGALFATGSIAPQQELFETNTGDKLPLVSTGHVFSAVDGVGVLYAPPRLIARPSAMTSRHCWAGPRWTTSTPASPRQLWSSCCPTRRA